MSEQRHHEPAGESLEYSQCQKIRSERTAALKLPAPGEDWALAEVSLEHAELQHMTRVGAVNHAGTEIVTVGEDGDNSKRNRWKTDPAVYQWIQKNLASTPECPAEGCHATGVTNPKGEEGYTCSNGECDVSLTRQEALDILG
jgi:hypothetical protein